MSYYLMKANQEWDLAGLARQDGDMAASARHTAKAREYTAQARDGMPWTPRTIYTCRTCGAQEPGTSSAACHPQGMPYQWASYLDGYDCPKHHS